MEATGAVQLKEIPRSFELTVKSLRHALGQAGLSVVQQFELAQNRGARRSALLMVDCPLLLFEAVALERSAAAFIPLHLVIRGDQRRTCVYWAHPAHSIGLRVSPTAEAAVDSVFARVSQVLSSADTWAAGPTENNRAGGNGRGYPTA